jgi:hypothetical protein
VTRQGLQGIPRNAYRAGYIVRSGVKIERSTQANRRYIHELLPTERGGLGSPKAEERGRCFGVVSLAFFDLQDPVKVCQSLLISKGIKGPFSGDQ